MSYWLKQTTPDSHDLDQVGLTLRSEGSQYVIAAVATKNGRPTVEGVLPGDKLIRVGGLELSQATWGAIFEALHGKPAESRSLILERNGNRFTVVAKVTGF
jgi:C-terminal processing protease CtpA/Prc